jgi:predicted nuclease of restriction endonuclease-like (RecB) superfamily
MKILIRLVDSMFKIALENESVVKDIRVYENLSLKYISFVQKYMENSLLSTFFLKKLANNQK